MSKVGYNERSWAIDLISEINKWVMDKDVLIKRAGGENTLHDVGVLFPDVLLYEDSSAGIILQGWELKMPDTSINDDELIKNAFLKAKILELNSFLVWNVNQANLYRILNEDKYDLIKTWTLDVPLSREEVKYNEKEWKTLLYSILNDLNYLFRNNQIMPTKTIDAITGETISEILLNNFKLVSETIHKECSSNSKLNDEINIWWISAQREYGKNMNKYDCLANLVLISWINKFLFANLLKKNNQSAYNIDNIVNNISINDAILIIEDISNNCDFKNIFQPQIGEYCIPDASWKNLLNFNSFLIDNRLEELDNQAIQSILKNVITNSKRKFYGLYPTPYNLSFFLSALVIEDKTKLVYDPCCGTGTIVRAAYDLKNRYVDEKDAINSLWASDKFNFPLQLAMLSLSNPDYYGELIRIFNDDVINLYSEKEIQFYNPINGNSEVIKLPNMDYIISNFPFVQHEDIQKHNPYINEKINAKIKDLTNNNDLELNGKSDLYCYIPFALWDLLNDDGILGMIISNSWSSTESGKLFYEILHYFFEVKYIITSGEGKWFEDVDVVTNIFVLKKRKVPIKNIDLDEKTTYITLKENIYLDEFYDDIETICSQIRMGSPSKKFLNVTYTKFEENKLFELGLSRNALFSNVKWLFDIDNKLIKANQIFIIKRGKRRGWNALFYPKNHNIEKEYIRKVVRNSKEIDGYITNTGKSDAFCCQKSLDELRELNHTGAINWIKQFENQTNKKGEPLPKVLGKSITPWYGMKEDTLADLCISVNPDRRLFFTHLKEQCFVDQRLIRFLKNNDDIDIKLAVALLNSILGIFFIESLGSGMGLGALDLNAENFNKNLPILNYNLLSDGDIKNILDKYSVLEKRQVYELKKELIMDDRKEFDIAVLSAFGIEKYYDTIYNSLISLYDMRKTVKK